MRGGHMGIDRSDGCEPDTKQKCGVDQVSCRRTISPERRSRMNAAPIDRRLVFQHSCCRCGFLWQEAIMRTNPFCNVQLSHLFPQARFIACDDIAASGCHDDPRQCGPGDVFIARNPPSTKGQFGGDFAGGQTLPARRFEPTTFLQLCSSG